MCFLPVLRVPPSLCLQPTSPLPTLGFVMAATRLLWEACSPRCKLEADGRARGGEAGANLAKTCEYLGMETSRSLENSENIIG